METLYNILLFLAGLGVFMKAMDLMSANMQNLFGFTIRNKLQKIASKPFFATLMGTGGTIALQSSTALVVLIISFAQIGVLTLAQCLPMVVGVNVGGSLIFISLLAGGFNLSIVFASLTIIGAFVGVFAKSTKAKAIGNVIFAFGLLFLGLYLISTSMSFLKTLDFVTNLFTTLTNPLLLLLIGLCLSLVMQSSLATNAVVISLCAMGDAGVGIAISSALWISIGSRIGPTGAGLLASIGKNKSAKSVAVFYTLFNCVTCLLFAVCTLLGLTDLLIGWLDNPALIIVVCNIVFSVLTAFVMFPLCGTLAKLLPKMYKRRKDMQDEFELDEALLAYPDSCIVQFTRQFELLFQSHTDNFKSLMVYCLEDGNEKVLDIKQIDAQNAKFYSNIEKVKTNLLKINIGLSDKQKAKIYFYIDCIGRFHSLADRTQKIISLFPKKPTKQFQKEQVACAKSLLKSVEQLNAIVAGILSADYDDELQTKIDVIDNALKIDEKISKGKLQLKKMLIKSYQDASVKQNFTDNFSRLINQLEQVGEHYSAICFFAYENDAIAKN